MEKCSYCGNENPDGSKFCARCGQSLVKVNHCPKCGKEVASDDIFCMNCGANLKPVPTRQNIAVTQGKETNPVEEKPVPVPSMNQIEPTVNEKNKPSAFKELMGKITPIAMFAILLGIFAAIWGTAVNCYVYNETSQAYTVTSIGPSYWFSDAWQILSFEAATPGVSMQKVAFLFGFIAFVSSVVGTYVFGIITLIQMARSLKNKDHFQKVYRPFGASVAFGGIHFLFMMTTWASTSLKNSTGLVLRNVLPGWGFILYLVLLVVLVIVLLLNRFAFDLPSFKEKKYSLINASVIAVFGVAFSFLAFGIIGGIKSNVETLYYGPYYGLTIVAGYAASDFSQFTYQFILSVISYMIYGIGTVVSSMLIGNIILYLGTGDPKDEKNMSSFFDIGGAIFLLGFAAALVAALSMASSLNITTQDSFVIPPTAVAALVLWLAGVMVNEIMKAIIKKKQKAESPTK